MLNLGDDAWRWMLASSAIPAALILIARIGTPESPRWLVNQGRIAEARVIVKKHLGDNVELDETRSTETRSGYAVLFSREYRKRTAFTRSEEHTSELQSLIRISYAVFCLNKK